MRSATGYVGPAVVDTQNLLIEYLRKRNIADVAISKMRLMRLRGYYHGMAQPAVFVIQKDETVLYSWAIVAGLVSEWTLQD